MDPLVRKARDFATQMHRRIDHRRKYSNQPYEAHLKAVAQTVATVSDDPETLAAAWLHDVVEDTETTLEEIRKEFGDGVAGLVDELTDVSRPGDGNRALRKAIDREHTGRASPRAKTVKLADLLDNCRDIRRGDPRFAQVFVRETQALLPRLREGDERLYARLEREIETSQRTLGMPEAAPVSPVQGSVRRERECAQRDTVNLFVDSVRALDLAAPLPWFDVDRDAISAARDAAGAGAEVIGLTERGLPCGYAIRDELDRGRCGDRLRPFLPQQTLPRDAALRDVVHVLNRHESCFVSLLGQVGGVIQRAHLNGPFVRMWLFGLVTLLEMRIVDQIRAGWPNETWRAQVPPGRLQKAEALAAERARRGQPADLLDCLQFADKGRLLFTDPLRREALGFKSVGAAEQAVKDVESLRNNLAHGQDIVTGDWVVIARLTRNLEEILENFPTNGQAPATRSNPA